MTIKRYPTPGDFLRDNTDFLEKYEAATQLNQGNAQANRDTPCCPEVFFGRYEQDGKTLLLFGSTAPWNLCLNAPAGCEELSAQAARELAGLFRAERIPLAGVTARDSLCQAFLEAYGGEFAQRSALDIMVLETLIEPPKAAGAIRKAMIHDLELVAAWKSAFYREALHEEAPEDLRERTQERLQKEVLWLMENESGEPVSMAQTTRQMAHGVAVSSVYTPPEHRGRGYCQNTVAALCREKLGEGFRFCTLFVDKKNPISNRVYRKIGFEVLEDCSEYRNLRS